MNYTVVSLFSGCGGLDYGFHQYDEFKLVYAADNNEAATACFTHNFNFAAKTLDVSTPEFLNDIKDIGSADIVLGGFPCQGFSKAGPKQKSDPRNILYTSMVKAVQQLKPKVFVAENVDGMAQNFNGEFVEIIYNDFCSLGYTVEHRILNAVDYGVAQYRRRIIFIGVQNSIKATIQWPLPTHFGGSRNGEFKTIWDVSTIINKSIKSKESLKKPISIFNAISDLIDKPLGSVSDHLVSTKTTNKDIAIIKKIGKGQKLCNVRFANTSVYTWNIPEVFGKVSDREIKILETIGKNRRKKIYGQIPNGNPLSIHVISELIGDEVFLFELESLRDRDYLKEINGKFDLKGAMFCSGLYKKPEWLEPSPTIITDFGNPRYFIHPILCRSFTIRECARLQSFPDSFKFLTTGISIDDAFRLIGNAVPPKLSEKLAEMVLTILNTKQENEIKDISTKPRTKAIRV